MALVYNGVTVEKVIYNGTELDTVVYNGVTVFESKPQLSTPQNVTADGTVVSWDEVENATEYEVYADGASIGTVQAERGETWVLSTDPSVDGQTWSYDINFESNGNSYSKLWVKDRGSSYDSYLMYDDTEAYWGSGNWVDYAYRTITFETAPTGDLLTWLQANGVKQ